MLGFAAVALVVAVLLLRGHPPHPVAPAALALGRAAGCGPVQTPAADAPGGLHLAPGAAYDYPREPATFGYHDPSPLPDSPQVLSEPVSDRRVAGVIPESRAVHNLEHAFVIVYYREAGPSPLPADVVDGLESLVRGEDRVLMAPHAELPTGTALALTAWNKLWECPAGIPPASATAVARAFIDAYRGTTNAPEAPVL
jgi:Protein of unknown function (DUF3105)